MIVVWSFAVIGFGLSVLLIVGWCLGPEDASKRSSRRPAASGEVVRRTARREDNERAAKEYRAVAAQYRALIDELYDFGEDVARRRVDGR